MFIVKKLILLLNIITNMDKKVEIKRERTTKKQIDILISFIEQNIDMINHKKDDYYATEKKWNELRDILNNHGSKPKTTKQWKTVFADLKTNTKRKARLVKVDVNGTGGGPAKSKPLTDVENRILNLINPIVIDGIDLLEPGLLKENTENVSFISNEENAQLSTISSDNIENDMNNYETATVVETVYPGISSYSRPITKPKNFGKTKFGRNTDRIMQSLVASNNNIAKALNRIAWAIKSKKN